VLFIDVFAAIPDEGPGMTIRHHVGPEVATIGTANRDSAAVAIEGPGFAGDMAVTDEGAQVLGGCLSCWPSVSAQVARLGRVDALKPIRHAIDPKRIAINHADGLGNSG
jgi:hypothetical protein